MQSLKGMSMVCQGNSAVPDSWFRISLRAELTPMEFHGHICDIRRRIEHEVTYEGETRRVK